MTGHKYYAMKCNDSLCYTMPMFSYKLNLKNIVQCYKYPTAVIFVLAAFIMLYQNSLHYYFIHEDADFVCAINEPGFLYHAESWGMRVLGDLMRWDFYIFGPNAWGYHLYNVLVHMLVCWLLFKVCRRLQIGRILSLFAVNLFFLHPIAFGTVSWIAGRLDVDASAWILATLLIYSQIIQKEEQQKKTTWKSWVAFFALALGAMLSKELGFILVVLIIPWEYALQGKICWKRVLSVTGTLIVTVVILYIIRLMIGASFGVYGEMHEFYGYYQLENIWKYILLLTSGGTENQLLVAITASFLATVILLLIIDRRTPFILALILLPMIIVSNLTVQTWYLYLPSTGLGLVLALALQRAILALRNSKSLLIKSTIILALFCPVTLLINGFPETLSIVNEYHVGSEFLIRLMRQFELTDNRPPKPNSIIIIKGLPQNVGGYILFSDEIGFDLDLTLNNNYIHGGKYPFDTRHTMVLRPEEFEELQNKENLTAPAMFYTWRDGHLTRDHYSESMFAYQRMKWQTPLYITDSLSDSNLTWITTNGLKLTKESGSIVLSGTGKALIGGFTPNRDYALCLKLRCDSDGEISFDERKWILIGDDKYRYALLSGQVKQNGEIAVFISIKKRIQIDEIIYGVKPNWLPTP